MHFLKRQLLLYKPGVHIIGLIHINEVAREFFRVSFFGELIVRL
jgi:hypothetical protein